MKILSEFVKKNYLSPNKNEGFIFYIFRIKILEELVQSILYKLT